MELVLNTPLHLDSLGRPVLDVTRTVNHLFLVSEDEDNDWNDGEGGNEGMYEVKLMMMRVGMRIWGK